MISSHIFSYSGFTPGIFLRKLYVTNLVRIFNSTLKGVVLNIRSDKPLVGKDTEVTGQEMKLNA